MASSGSIISRLTSYAVGKPADQTSQVDLSDSEMKILLDRSGLEMINDPINGGTQIVPKGSPNSKIEIEGFSQLWAESAYVGIDTKQDEKLRNDRYRHYEFMDMNSTVSALTLDTYADESVVTGLSDDNPIKIKVSDKKAQKEIIEILKQNDVISESDKPSTTRGEIRYLAKYGDRFYKIIREGKDAPIKLVKVADPTKVSILSDPMTGKMLGYSDSDKNRYFPWEFSHSCIPDGTFYPYGRSILEGMRSSYMQLVMNEALLALSRASKVERLVFRAPVNTSNPTSAFAVLAQMRSQFSSVIFGNSGSAKSKSKVSALTDILWYPSGDGFDIERLQSSIDVSSIEDVEYFRDIFLMGTRLPKSYLLADDTQRIEGSALAAQDLKFARALVPLQHGYVEGMTRLINTLIVLLGYDPTKVTATVSMDKPQALVLGVVQAASDNIALIQNMIDGFAKATGSDNGGQILSPDEWVSLVNKITGIPKEFLSAFRTKGSHDPEKERDLLGDWLSPTTSISTSTVSVSSLGLTNEEFYAEYITNKNKFENIGRGSRSLVLS